MSKRRRTDYEDGIQNANGLKYGGDGAGAAAGSPLDYDDEAETVDTPLTPPGPYSYTVEKRQKTSDQEIGTDDAPDPTKPARKRSNKPQVHSFFGQTGAFPDPSSPSSTADPADEEAWTYLLSVRAEAESLPSVYRLPPTSDDPPPAAPTSLQPIISDGACIAPPRLEPTTSLPKAQEACYAAMLARFARHRAQLSSRPRTGGEAVCAAKLAEKASPPNEAAGLGQAAALRLLGLLDAEVDAALTTGGGVPGFLGQWAWALLGVLPGPGELTNTEVGIVRDLAKRCAWGISWRKMSGEETRAEAMGFLEFVVTVVGEVWGQRDLLEGRVAWE